MNVLISAYSCDPNSGSEKGVGWNYPYRLSKFINITLITRKKNKEAIENYLAYHEKYNLKILYYDLPSYLRFWKIGKIGMYLYYIIWHLCIYVIFKKKYKKYDIYHYLTFGTFWLPSFIPLLPIKYIWGPTGGAERSPKFYTNKLHIKEQLYEIFRNININIAKVNPLVRKNVNNANTILSKSLETKQFLSNLTKSKIKLFSEAAVENVDINTERKTENDFIFISVGRLISLKGYQYSLVAFSKFLKMHKARYIFLGDGEYMGELKNICSKLNIANKVEFIGHVDREKIFRYLKKSDILLHPSMHDSGGWACIEAMSVGCPVIALNIGGPAVQIVEGCGYLINPMNENQIISDITDKMQMLYNNPTLLKSMRKNCIEYIGANYTWDNKIKNILNIYEATLING